MPAGEEHVMPQQLLVCKEEVPPEQQEQTPSLDQEEPEPPHIKEEEEELWTNQEAEQLQDVTTLQVTAVKSEEEEEEAQPSQLHPEQQQMEAEAARSSDPAADVQPISDEQLLCSHSSEETEDSEDEWRPAGRSEPGSAWTCQSSPAAHTVMSRENRHHDAAQLQVRLTGSREHAQVRGGFRGSQPITDRNDKEKRTAYFTAEEQRIILEKYEEEKLNIHLKSNTAAAAKSRQNAWQRIADYINACNPSGVKRTWGQVKVKHKNIIALANRKRNLQRQTGRGGPGENSSPAEELGLSNEARPIKDGVEAGVASSPGSQSTHVTTYGEIMEVVVPGVPLTSNTMSQAEVGDIGDETLSTSSDRAVEEERHPSPGEPRASTGTGRQSRASTCWGGRATQLKRSQKSAADPVRTLYKRSLEKDMKYKDLKMQKMELEIEYLKLKIAKLKEQEENHYK